MLPFLNTGILLAENQSFGKIPDLSDWVNIICRIGAICFAHVIKIHVGILSGPAALPGLRFFRRDSMPLYFSKYCQLQVVLPIENFYVISLLVIKMSCGYS